MVIGLIIILIILVLLSIYLIFYRPINSKIEKTFFKINCAKKIYMVAKNHDCYLLNKVAIKVEGKIIHFDHILFGDKFIYCIVTRYYSVALNGKLDDASWFHYFRNNDFEIIKNPLRLNKERVDYFSSLITSSKEIFVGMLIVNNSCLIDKIEGVSNNELLINIRDFEKTIKRYEQNESVTPIEPHSLKLLVKDIYSKCIEE